MPSRPLAAAAIALLMTACASSPPLPADPTSGEATAVDPPPGDPSTSPEAIQPGGCATKEACADQVKKADEAKDAPMAAEPHEKPEKLEEVTPAKTSKASGGLEVDGANVSIGSMSADGFTMKDIACKSDGGGLGALLLGPVLAQLAASKGAQLRACSPKGGEPRVRFTMAGGKVTSAEAKASTPAIEACLVKVMKTMAGATDAICAVTLELGK